MAGGLNAYGFADGDPVSYTDPFGLSACPPDCEGGSFDGSMAAAVFADLAKKSPAMEDAIVGFLPTSLSLSLGGVGGAARSALSAPVRQIAGTLQAGSGSGTITAAAVAGRVAEATGGVVSALKKSEGYRVTVEAGRTIVARIKSSGDMRVAIDRVGALTREGVVSADRARTHLKNLSSRELVDLIQSARQWVGAAK